MKLNPISMIISLIFAVPFIGINLYALGAWESFTRGMEQVDPDAVDQGPPQVLGNLGKGFFDFVGERRDRSELHAVFDVDTPTRKRFIMITRRMTIEDVLFADEPAPAEEYHQLYLLARAPAMIMAECEALLKTVAKVCAVSDAEVDKMSNGTFDVDLRVGFLPADAAGDLTLIDASSLDEKSYRVLRRSDGPWRETDLPALREKVYQSAQDTCNTLRAQVGTCVIRRITINQREIFDGGYEVGANFTLAWLKNNESMLLAAKNSDIDVAGVAEDTNINTATRPGTTPPPNVDLAMNNEPSGGIGGFFSGIKSALDGSGQPPAQKPTVLNGGGAFGGGNGGKFVSVNGQ